MRVFWNTITKFNFKFLFRLRDQLLSCFEQEKCQRIRQTTLNIKYDRINEYTLSDLMAAQGEVMDHAEEGFDPRLDLKAIEIAIQ